MRRVRSTVSALLIAFLPLQACSGDDDDAGPQTPGDVAGDGTAQTLVGVADEPAGAHCAAGGVAITRGVDADGDGMLDAAEVEDSHYACNADLAKPASGAGSAVVMIATEVLASGDAHCPTGGVAVHRGADDNADGTLAAAERDNTDYVCNGANLDGSAVCMPPARWDAAAGSCVSSVDWSGAELASAELGSTYLAGIDLSGADLSGANLTWSDLRGVSFVGADLTGADLSHALVDGADFSNAVLDGADLTGVDLRRATLTDATASNLVACPERMPDQWTCVDLGALGKTLLGPGTGLSGLDLSAVDLSNAELRGTQTTQLVACPADLPPQFGCLDLPQTGKTLVGPGVDLSGLDLSNANFSALSNLRNVSFEQSKLNGATFAASTNLSDARFSGADLTGVSLSSSNLEGATGINLVACPASLPGNFSCRALPHTGNTLLGPGIDLSGLDLSGADLQNVDLSGADLSGANLSGAVLNGADLNGADLRDATLTGVQAANLDSCPDSLPSQWRCKADTLLGPGANLSGLNLSGLDFSGNGTHLEGADLSSANLTDAVLSDAHLNGADLSSANLTDATLESVNLSGATLDSANLTGANLNDATVANATFAGATFSNTTCPNGNNSNTQGNTCL